MRRGITVIALLAVLIVLAVLATLLIPWVGNVRRAAARTHCQNNLRQLGLSVSNFQDAYNHFPPGTVQDTQLPADQRLSFCVSILPYVECNSTYYRMHLTEAWDSEANRAAVVHPWRIFVCPAWNAERGVGATQREHYLATTNYVGMAGLGADAALRPADSPGIGLFGYDRTLKTDDVKDGLASTIMLIETGTDLGPWLRGGPSTVRPLDLTGGSVTGEGLPFGGTHFRNTLPFRAPEPVAFHVLLADASVREFRDTVAPEVLTALATVAGGEALPVGW